MYNPPHIREDFFMLPMKNTLLILFLASVLYVLSGCQLAPTPLPPAKTISTEPAAANDTVHITAVGDIMMGSAFPGKESLPPDDGRRSFTAVQPFLRGDIVFANLEGCFLDTGLSKKCKHIRPQHCYVFRMPDRYAGLLKTAGFNVLSLANNHIGDFGSRGVKNTARILDSLGIYHAGQLQNPFVVFEKNKVRYAFCAFGFSAHTPSITQIAAAKTMIHELNKQVDIVIVSFHGGGEGASYEHVTQKTEYFHKENRGNVYAFAHAMIDAGADVVLGHGPHVTRAVEVYKNRFIAYSLGNFCTYGAFNLSGPNGYAPLLQLKTDKDGRFLLADVLSVKQDKQNGLQIDTGATAFKKIVSLTHTDFKDHPLLFSDKRRISLKP